MNKLADTVSSEEVLKMGFQRSDETVQYISVPNAANVETEDIRDVMSNLARNQIIVDSKTGDVFSESSIFTASRNEKTTVTLDLT